MWSGRLTYALRGCHGALLAGSKPALGSSSLVAAGGAHWLLTGWTVPRPFPAPRNAVLTERSRSSSGYFRYAAMTLHPPRDQGLQDSPDGPPEDLLYRGKCA